MQKYGFWRAKRGFLHCKSMVFAMQKLAFCVCCCAIASCKCTCKHNFMVFADTYTPTKCQTVSRRRGPIYRIRIHEYPQNGIAIHRTVPTNTHKMALQFVIFRTSRQIEKREKQTHDVCSSLVFYVLN